MNSQLFVCFTLILCFSLARTKLNSIYGSVFVNPFPVNAFAQVTTLGKLIYSRLNQPILAIGSTITMAITTYSVTTHWADEIIEFRGVDKTPRQPSLDLIPSGIKSEVSPSPCVSPR